MIMTLCKVRRGQSQQLGASYRIVSLKASVCCQIRQHSGGILPLYPRNTSLLHDSHEVSSSATMVFTSMRAAVLATLVLVAVANESSCGSDEPSKVKDCDHTDLGSCGNACCLLDITLAWDAETAYNGKADSSFSVMPLTSA